MHYYRVVKSFLEQVYTLTYDITVLSVSIFHSVVIYAGIYLKICSYFVKHLWTSSVKRRSLSHYMYMQIIHTVWTLIHSYVVLAMKSLSFCSIVMGNQITTWQPPTTMVDKALVGHMTAPTLAFVVETLRVNALHSVIWIGSRNSTYMLAVDVTWGATGY